MKSSTESERVAVRSGGTGSAMESESVGHIPLSIEPRETVRTPDAATAREGGRALTPSRRENGVGETRTARDRAGAALEALFGVPADRGFAVRYWDGTVEGPRTSAPRFTLVIRSPGALRRAFLVPTELRLAEAYIRGDVDIEGDIEAAAAIGTDLGDHLRSPATLARAIPHLLALPRDAEPPITAQRRGRAVAARHSRTRDRSAVRAHYDMGNEFYALWLDRALVYSCGYFPDGVTDIDAAQEAKLDLICRKLRLRPGERLLDIGCGWGGLIRHAARYYGVDALGITLSEQQAALARERIAADGLSATCRVEVRDYREFPPSVVFDKVVSVGMFEHVGRSRLARYFREAARLTRPGGLFLNHGIVRARAASSELLTMIKRALMREGVFIDRYVFPDGELVPLDVAVRLAERAGLETRDVESLREHYALTLRQWVRRLERARETVEALVGEQAYRVWRLYMAASAHAFSVRRIGLAQILLARPDSRGRVSIPRTRADLYAPRHA